MVAKIKLNYVCKKVCFLIFTRDEMYFSRDNNVLMSSLKQMNNESLKRNETTEKKTHKWNQETTIGRARERERENPRMKNKEKKNAHRKTECVQASKLGEFISIRLFFSRCFANRWKWTMNANCKKAMPMSGCSHARKRNVKRHRANWTKKISHKLFFFFVSSPAFWICKQQKKH